MIYDSLEIEGFRGFGAAQKITFATPNGSANGSGLTIIVGENNSGKSSIIEALRSFTTASPTFFEGQRNKDTQERVRLVLRAGGKELLISTVSPGGAAADFVAPSDVTKPLRILALPSRRHFDPQFGGGGQDRAGYEHVIQANYKRSAPLQALVSRLVAASQRRPEFDAVLSRLIDPVPEWVIEKLDPHQSYIKICRSGRHYHSTEGAGEGLLNLMCIADALYDSSPGDVIAIDEPELSLHPSVLRRLNSLLGEYAIDRQIVLSTHSPYFADPAFLCNGGTLCRVFLTEKGSNIAQIQRSTISRLEALLGSSDNPHVLGLDAREIFFQNDRIILVEGQEDVVFYPKIESQLDLTFQGSFFGWGVGGASNMDVFVNLLNDLRFSKVVGILDSDKADIANDLQERFSQYRFLTIGAPDVRTKDARKATSLKPGLIEHGVLKEEFKASTRTLIEQINNYLQS